MKYLYKMGIKYTNYSKAPQNAPKLRFLVSKYAIWQPRYKRKVNIHLATLL
jgi:hypothetical protein